MTKLDLVMKILKTDSDIAAWYRDEYYVDFNSFNMTNINRYGIGGLGEVADLILEDGLKENIITEQEVQGLFLIG